MKKTLQLAASAAAFGAFALGASADTTTSWWDVDFESAETWADGETVIQVAGSNGASGGSFTKSIDDKGDISDESYIDSTNDTKVLRLNTQGSELKFTPTAEAPNWDNAYAVIEADISFVGSETAPTVDDDDVQVALYLNQPDGGGQPFLQARAWVDTDNEWVTLKYYNEALANQTPVRVKITLKEEDNIGKVTYQFKLPGDDQWSEGETLIRANQGKGTLTGYGIREVGFRGTGYVDNFLGTYVEQSSVTMTFAAELSGLDDDTAAEWALETVSSTGNSITFSGIFGQIGDLSLVEIELLDSTGAKVGTAIPVTYDEETDQYTVQGNAYYDGEIEVTVDVAALRNALESSYEEGTEISAIRLVYGTGSSDEPEYYDEGDEAVVTQALYAGFDAVREKGDVPLAFDEEAGFTVKFVAQIAGTYQLVAVDNVDDDFDVDNGDGQKVGQPQTVEAGETVTLSDEDNVGEDALAKRFYKILLTNGKKSAND